MVVAKSKIKIVKKKRSRFNRFASEKWVRLHPNWRKPRGIDNRMRRKFGGTAAMPGIGFGSDRRTRFRRPDHFYTFHVNNPKDIDLLLMHTGTYAAEIASTIGAKKRKAILKRAAKMGVKVENAKARVRAVEKE
ncbi:60S ribosomal protein L32 [Pelomyxa schiedti]|nr:60S ribosomal protein L32 [Pelomyxa schiedti]